MILLIGKVKTSIVNPLMLLLMALAAVYFLYGVYEFIANFDSEEKRAAGRQHMLWGVIGLFIIVSVFGIINLIYKTFDIPTQP